MSYRHLFSLIAAAGVIAIVPLSRAEAHGYRQHNLVSNRPAAAMADHTDPNLVNPWGVAFFPGGPFWISDNAANPDGLSTLYDGAGNIIDFPATSTPFAVTIPTEQGDTGQGAPGPTGMVWNGSPLAFPVGNNPQNTAPALFIWATEDGTIAAWQPALSPVNVAVTVFHNPKTLTDGPVYKGLAIGNNSSGLFLYATDFRDASVVVWDSTFAVNTALSAKFADHQIPTGFAPFGLQNINGQLWVTYARQDSAKHDPKTGASEGFVDVFDTDGNLLNRFARRGVLDAPWGVVLAPDNFGQFSNDILIGNFGDGRISAWNPDKGKFIDWIRDGGGKTIELGSLWDLVFGGGLNADPQTLYFTTGLVNEGDGLLGTLTPK
ncbi:MAG: TIGR03118 family protein [Candidatus Binataceae bacterium]